MRQRLAHDSIECINYMALHYATLVQKECSPFIFTIQQLDGVIQMVIFVTAVDRCCKMLKISKVQTIQYVYHLDLKKFKKKRNYEFLL